jgi:hypothetical protein
MHWILLQSSSFLSTTIMRSIPSNQHSSIISILNKGYSLCQIQSRTGLGKSTIGRIKKEVNQNKENSKGGHPSKLSYHNKQTTIHQSPLEGLIMLSKQRNLSTPSYPTLSPSKQSGMSSRRTISTLLSRRNALYLRSNNE